MGDSKWIEHLRHQASQYEIAPPPDLWENIERAVSSSSVSSKGRIWPLLLRYGSIAACVAIAIVLGFVWHHPAIQEGSDMASIPHSDTQTAQHLIAEETPAPPKSLLPTKPIASHRPRVMNRVNNMVTPIQVLTEISENSTSKDSCSLIKNNTEDTDTFSDKDIISSPDPIYNSSSIPVREWIAHKPTSQTKALAVSVYGTNLSSISSIGGSSVSRGVLYELASPDDRPPLNPDQDEPENSTPSGSKTRRQEPRGKSSASHDLPLRFGASINIPFSDRLSLETGITYSILTSKFTYEQGSSGTTTDQTLHYLGIPVKLRYTLWENRRFSIYCLGGGMAEKCISGTAEVLSTHSFMSWGKTHPKDTRVQFSAGAAAGAEFRASSAFSIYLEPGLNYYFDNHSSIQNYYKAHPFTPDIKLGLRLSINH